MSISARASLHSHLLRVLAVAHVFFGCAFSDVIFQLPVKEVRQKIYAGEHQFLREVTPASHDFNDVTRLHNGARYYLSEIYRSLKLEGVSDTLLQLEWTREQSPWGYKAGLDMLESLSEKKAFYRAEYIAQKGLEKYRNDRRYLYYYLEALYWQGKYDRVLKLVDRFRARINFERAYPLNKTRWNNAEAQLWEAVSRYRGDIDYHQSEFDMLFFNYSANVYHTRVYDYIIDEPKLHDAFADWQIAFYKAKHLTNLRSYRGAARAYEEALEDIPAAALDRVLTLRTIRDIGRAYLYGGYSKTGAARLTELSSKVTQGERRAMSLEWRGRLHTRMEEYQAAQEVFYKSHQEHPSDRALWLMFNAAFSRSFSNGLIVLQQYSYLIRNREYYSDLFERQIADAVHNREWVYLWHLRDIIIKYGSAYDRAHIAVVMAEGVRTGVTVMPRRITISNVRRELDVARRQTESTYYAYLAGFMLRRNAVRTFSSSSRYSENTVFSRSECRKLIDGYWDFHLIREGYNQLKKCIRHYSTNEIIKLAKGLYRRDIFNYAIRTLDIARSRDDFKIARATERILYPRAYSEFIDGIAKRNKIPLYFFYSTIREESYFTNTVNSHAGAIGLGQFIPSTARAVANRMNIPYPDLTDPEQNLRLSGFHLRELTSTLDNKPLFALAAYNAGIGRAKRWMRVHDDYSDLLKHEAIHIYETRHYIRKIMVTNIQYARIYQRKEPKEIIKEYFIDLRPL